MTDDVVTLNFNSSANLLYDGSGAVVGNLSGSINIDYTTNTVTSAALTVNYAGSTFAINSSAVSAVATLKPTYPVDYSIILGQVTSVNNQDGTTTLTYPNGALELVYNGTNPSSIGVLAFTPGTSITINPNVPGSTPVVNTGHVVATSPSFTTASSPSSIIDESVTSTQVTTGTITPLPQVCYVAGTLIRTVRGDVPVEELRVGDLAVTTSGAARPIVWLGHRKLDCAAHPDPRSVCPVRIVADAFGPGLPERDLYVSPGHSLCVSVVDEALVQAFSLENGATIARLPVDTVDYWHVELESHDILFANGLPAESYLDAENRGFFSNAGDAPDAKYGSDWLSRFCRPCINEGPVRDAVRLQLIARAERLGWRHDVETDLRLIVDGEETQPMCLGDVAVFHLPNGARDVRLRSRVFSPESALGEGDGRRLGVKLLGVSIGDGSGSWRRIALDDPRLAQGFHDVEANGAWRWTDGEAVLPPELWHNVTGDAVTLQIGYDVTVPRGWIAPASTSDDRLAARRRYAA